VIQGVIEAALDSMEENFIALVDKPVVLKSRAAGSLPRDQVLAALAEEATPCMVGAVGKSYAGKVLLLVNLADSITCACYLGMIPEDVTKDRRKEGSCSEEDMESFGEVGNILFSAVDEVFRAKLAKPVSFRLESALLVEPGGNAEELLSGEDYYAHRLEIKIGEFPEGECLLIMPYELGESMNQGPLRAGGEEKGEEFDEDLPEEIDGELSVFAHQGSTHKLARAAADRLGMKVDIRPPGTVPNPSKLKGKFVLIEIPEEGEQYFQWCSRLKKTGGDTAVVAALEWPTKRSVLMAYKAGVDQILGLPSDPGDLARRLGRIVKAREHAAAAEEE
jgi:hypothetical protein